jgi:uncharacterized protein (TIGR00297 family)
MKLNWRLLAGLVCAGSVSAFAVRRGSLSRSGGAAATLVGALAFATGSPSTRSLLAFFATSSALSHLPFEGRDHRPRRTARQVMANGGVASAAWTASLLGCGRPWDRAAAGSLAAAAADTWATELGQRYGGVPRLITSGRPVQPGESGGITLVGTVAAVCGALVVALSESGLRPHSGIVPAGLLGALADSVLGASVQARYACPACAARTEQPEHCGRPGQLISGCAWITNDTVNVLATLIGGLVCMGLDHQSR